MQGVIIICFILDEAVGRPVGLIAVDPTGDDPDKGNWTPAASLGGFNIYQERCWQMIQSGQVELGYSHEESIAFRTWSDMQFTKAREHFLEQRDDPERGVLNYVDKSGQVVSQGVSRSSSDE